MQPKFLLQIYSKYSRRWHPQEGNFFSRKEEMASRKGPKPLEKGSKISREWSEISRDTPIMLH